MLNRLLSIIFFLPILFFSSENENYEKKLAEIKQIRLDRNAIFEAKIDSINTYYQPAINEAIKEYDGEYVKTLQLTEKVDLLILECQDFSKIEFQKPQLQEPDILQNIEIKDLVVKTDSIVPSKKKNFIKRLLEKVTKKKNE